eukprot:scaffold84041_cov48-Phaeocystis_antarctica.AAC.1
MPNNSLSPSPNPNPNPNPNSNPSPLPPTLTLGARPGPVATGPSSSSPGEFCWAARGASWECRTLMPSSSWAACGSCSARLTFTSASMSYWPSCQAASRPCTRGLRQVHFLAKYWAEIRGDEWQKDVVAEEYFPFISAPRFTLKTFARTPSMWFGFTKDWDDFDVDFLKEEAAPSQE